VLDSKYVVLLIFNKVSKFLRSSHARTQDYDFNGKRKVLRNGFFKHVELDTFSVNRSTCY